MRRGGVFLAAALLGGAATWVVLAHRERPAAPIAVTPAATEDDVASLRGEVAALRTELAVARSRAAPAAADAKALAMVEPPPASPEAANAAIFAKVETAFAGEPPDASWSAPAAAAITRDLQTAGIGGALRGVSCGSTMCRVDLSLDDPELRANLTEQVTALDSFKTQIVYVHHVGDPPTVSLYAARAGHPLPM